MQAVGLRAKKQNTTSPLSTRLKSSNITYPSFRVRRLHLRTYAALLVLHFRELMGCCPSASEPSPRPPYAAKTELSVPIHEVEEAEALPSTQGDLEFQPPALLAENPSGHITTAEFRRGSRDHQVLGAHRQVNTVTTRFLDSMEKASGRVRWSSTTDRPTDLLSRLNNKSNRLEYKIQLVLDSEVKEIAFSRMASQRHSRTTAAKNESSSSLEVPTNEATPRFSSTPSFRHHRAQRLSSRRFTSIRQFKRSVCVSKVSVIPQVLYCRCSSFDQEERVPSFFSD